MIAAGIEPPSQLGRLRDPGCALGQGFLFANPMTRAEAGRLLESTAREPA